MLIYKEFKFDSAHNLISYKGKCERLHGHTYKMRVTLKGEPDSEGMIMDFLDIKKIVNEHVIAKLDHNYINDIISQPTAENIALWSWRELENNLRRDNCELYEIRIWETEDSCVILSAEK